MGEPLSYKELENLVKSLKQEKQQLVEELKTKTENSQSKEKLYHQLISHTNEGILLVQRDRIKFANQPALNLLETSRSDIEKVSFTDFIHPDYKGQVIQQISDIINAKADSFELVVDLIIQNSKVLNVKLDVEKFLNQNNQVAVLVKLTDNKSTKDREIEVNKLRRTIDFIDKKMSEGIVLLKKTDSEHALFSCTIEDVNHAAERLFEKEKPALLGQKLGDFFVPDFEYILPEGNPSGFEDELELYLEPLKKYFHITLFVSGANKVTCKFQEVTEFHLTKDQLNKNLQRNELITEILGIFNSAGTYKEKFSKVLERVGYHFKPKRVFIIHNSTDEKKGRIYQQWVNKGVNEYSTDFFIPFFRVPSWHKMLKERNMILGFSLKYLPEDLQAFFKGIHIDCVYIFPLKVNDKIVGSVVYENLENNDWDNTEINFLKMVSVLISYLTGSKINEEHILAAKNKAEEADRLKSSFLANMSHDIRIPMTAIIGFSDLLADPDLTIGEREEFIELISKSGEDLLTLVDNIVDVAKIETGQLRIQHDDCSISHLFSDLYQHHVKNLKILEQDNLDLSYELPEKYQNLIISTDVFRLKQVFNNLIDNGIKFTDAGGIKFGISNIYKNTVEFYVSDTGIGIAEETQHIIFEQFGKIDRSYTKEYTGTGLGLAICKSLVELLGGEIRVISYPGKGSTFYFTHPANEEQLKKVGMEPQKKSGPYDWTGKNIVIVEDVEQNYKYLEFIIQPTNASIKWMKDGVESVEYFKAGHNADAVLMDIRLPRMNGIEATREISKISNVPIIAQTAYTLGDEKRMAFEAGCIDYFSKPVNGPKLLKMLEKYFNETDKKLVE